MADCIRREEALDFLIPTFDLNISAQDKRAIAERFVEFLENIPAADVVEVVRCEYCKRWKDPHDYECPFHSSGDPYIDYDPEPDFFCAIGERRMDNG